MPVITAHLIKIYICIEMTIRKQTFQTETLKIWKVAYFFTKVILLSY